MGNGRDFFEKVAQDLLDLEVNTIIKADMSGAKLPASRRQALYMIATEYHEKLVELEKRQPIYWEYAGMRSFGELRDRAQEGAEELKNKINDLTEVLDEKSKKVSLTEEEKLKYKKEENELQYNRENMRMLERIQGQSSQIVGMFKMLEQDFSDKITGENTDGNKSGTLMGIRSLPGRVVSWLKGDAEDRSRETKRDIEPDEEQPPDPHLASLMWNNDIDEMNMSKADLNLNSRGITVVNTVWEATIERAKVWYGVWKIELEQKDKLPDDMPIRKALYELAKIYNEKLEKCGVRQPVQWQYGGRMSFDEIRFRAEMGIAKLERNLGKTDRKDEKQRIRKRIEGLEHVRDGSSEIIRVFDNLERSIYNERTNKTKLEQILRGYAEIRPASPDTHTQAWNNDITREQMNRIQDLELTPDQVTLIRKAWEIGTERILLQTIIQIDGDVTTRMSGYFAYGFSDDWRKMLLGIHNNSISTSTTFWSNLVKAMSEMARDAFSSILGRK